MDACPRIELLWTDHCDEHFVITCQGFTMAKSHVLIANRKFHMGVTGFDVQMF